MDHEDLICQKDLDAALAVAQGMLRREVALAVVGGLVFGVLYVVGANLVVARPSVVETVAMWTLVWLFVSLAIGIPWWREQKAVIRQIAQLQQRILAGEVVYLSQVSFGKKHP